ncbi:flagellar protein FlaG [Thalassospira xianhensis]|uniref:flagellar protein FlaG n=1 Tax=Thalassospira xianhensis TaxID=478503 RepID=UPI000DED8162|nr:flagellar protein FlaG [Thalassospira xianhensis]
MEIVIGAYQSQRSSGSSSGSEVSASLNTTGQSATIKSAVTSSDANHYKADAGARLQQALAKLDIPELSEQNSRIELNFNQDTGRVIAKVTDRFSGEILREIPSKELQNLFAQIREYLGSVVDEEI